MPLASLSHITLRLNKYLIFFAIVILLTACSTNQTISNLSESSVKTSDETQVKLSHVKAYLMIGNINQAQESFNAINTTSSQNLPNSLITLSELRAATGDAEGAQKAFLLALSSDPFDKISVPETLTDYLCIEKKWPALQGYASTLVAGSTENHSEAPSTVPPHLKSKTLTQIGLCFFNEQHLEQAQKWLGQLDMTQQIDPQAHLALARIAVQKNQLSVAQESINQYETTKTKIDAKMLWTAFEVYQALNEPGIATKTGDDLYSLFPHNEYTRKYILTKKRGERIRHKQQETITLQETINSSPERKLLSLPAAPAYEQSIHIMKKGETLYQLSKRYDVSIVNLLRWNPDLVVNDISLGTKIRLFAD
jgi:Tfp pilus assembly protein PilF